MYMSTLLTIGGFLASLALLHWFYWAVIVPHHYRYAAKRGLGYDPRRNCYYKETDGKRVYYG
jgi:hypothetical protein